MVALGDPDRVRDSLPEAVPDWDGVPVREPLGVGERLVVADGVPVPVAAWEGVAEGVPEAVGVCVPLRVPACEGL